MKIVKIKIAIIVLSAAFFSCSNPAKIEVRGTITNSNSPKVYLEKLGINGTTPFDSSKIDSKGNFKLSGTINQPTFFILKLNDQKFITLLLDSLEKVTFSADYINFSSDYTIEGSPGSKKVKTLNQHLIKTNNHIDSIKSIINYNAGSPYQTENEEKKWIAELNKVYIEQQEYSKKFILDNPFSMASVLAIYQKFNDGNYIVQDLQTIKVAASALNSMYPNSEHAKTLYEDTKKLIKQTQNQEFQELVKNTGVNTPEINLPDRGGKKIALSSLRGKYVLVQFWSALDQNSRSMNPVLKENYRKFNSRGFEIYQVSIDTSKQAWIQAIETDQLKWINVGDMQGSHDAITSYNIRSIPSNYLLDKDGVILSKDLNGSALNDKLSEILN
jgi:peroxiredoxin